MNNQPFSLLNIIEKRIFEPFKIICEQKSSEKSNLRLWENLIIAKIVHTYTYKQSFPSI